MPMRFLSRSRPTIVQVSLVMTAIVLSSSVNIRHSLAQQLDEKRLVRLGKQFEERVFPSFEDGETGCVDCHSSESVSNLFLTGEPEEDFRRLLEGGFLHGDGPDTLLGRLTSENPERRMPKDAEPWSPQQVNRLRELVHKVERWTVPSEIPPDEQFPQSLLEAYRDDRKPQIVSQFISYHQLRNKIQSVFSDDGTRGEHNLFDENLAALGGADFKRRFNESTQPTETFLSALESIARDVATRAYHQRSGPFAGLQLPRSTNASNSNGPSVEHAITTLFERILFRKPSREEFANARALIHEIGSLEQLISARDSILRFKLEVHDPESGLTASRVVTIPVSGDHSGVRQANLDQRGISSEANEVVQRVFSPLVSQLAKTILPSTESNSAIGSQRIGRATLGPNQAGRLVLHNVGTFRNVSFAGVELRSINSNTTTFIEADSNQVQVEGAWTLDTSGGFSSYEDEGRHKGLSIISVTLAPEQLDEYEVSVRWRTNPKNSDRVLVELFSSGIDNRLVSVDAAESQAIGIAQFHYDCGDDSIPYVELPGSYQFDSSSEVVISNRDTLDRVTAGAIELFNTQEPGNNFLIDSKIAKGSDDWKSYDEGRFGAYNVRGKKLHDNNERKGELSLRYQLADRIDHGWRPDEFYRIRVFYPGKRDHEPKVPVAVHAKRSSPIIRVSHPLTAKADATVRLDASASFTVQQSELQFKWKQLDGPRVDIQDPHRASLTFTAPRVDPVDLAWASLAAGLVRHPDFLFTFPPSSVAVQSEDLRRLQLTKVAMDLLGRPPTMSEFAQLSKGRSLEDFVDQFLDSEDFRSFYFHRVRLYLESQGTDTQDEPARLWSYVAFEDRPFQEILTANYTVDEAFERVERDPQHGRTGLLTTTGFIQGKPGLPHYNYSAQVSMLFLGFVYEVPPEIVEQREGVTALGTTDPNSNCYSCHKILTPLAFQRLNWTDDGQYREKDESGVAIDASDRGSVAEYPFKGTGMEAFAKQAVKKERFIRTMINTHVNFYFGRPLRHLEDERTLYKRLWDHAHQHDFQIRSLIRAIVLSPEYQYTGTFHDQVVRTNVSSLRNEVRDEP